jgi:hypothetical protein
MPKMRRGWPTEKNRLLNESARLRSQRDFAGVAQLVEHKLPKLGVVGSNPISRSKDLATMDAQRASIALIGGLTEEVAPVWNVLTRCGVELGRLGSRLAVPKRSRALLLESDE